MGWSEFAAMWMTVFSVLVLVTAVMDHHWIFVQAPTQNYYSGIWKVCTKLTCTSIIAISCKRSQPSFPSITPLDAPEPLLWELAFQAPLHTSEANKSSFGAKRC